MESRQHSIIFIKKIRHLTGICRFKLQKHFTHSLTESFGFRNEDSGFRNKAFGYKIPL